MRENLLLKISHLWYLEWIFFKLDYLENMLNTFSVTGGIMIKILGRNLFKFLDLCACLFII